MKMHKSVLLGEAIEILKVKEGDIVVDATLGSGGHTIEFAKKVGASGKVISIDIDKYAIEQTTKSFGSEHPELANRIVFVNDNFANIKKILLKEQIENVNVIFADLGWRIEQIEDVAYGMSFRKDAKLDMRLDRDSQGLSAHEIVNNWSEGQLEDIFRRYGEERQARSIARQIIASRESAPIETTTQLAKIVELKYKQKPKNRLHAATKVFQALRIATNDELNNLEKFLDQSIDLLGQRGRIGIISFHSLEDRIVKNVFRSNARGCVCPREIPVCVCGKKSILKVITAKPVTASAEEVALNPRSRSAKMRVAEKI